MSRTTSQKQIFAAAKDLCADPDNVNLEELIRTAQSVLGIDQDLSSMDAGTICDMIKQAHKVWKARRARKKFEDLVYQQATTDVWNEYMSGMRTGGEPNRRERQTLVDARFAQLLREYEHMQ